MNEQPSLTRFFDVIYGADEGYVCIGTAPIENPKSGFRQTFFEWPINVDKVNDFILRFGESKNMWFCVNLLSRPERTKKYCLPTRLLWTDLDESSPDNIDIPPPIVIESSPERYQAIWILSESIDPVIAEDYSKRIAYKYGADKSGWDLTQLLRVPGTFNFKYDGRPMVRLHRWLPKIAANPTLFESIPRLWNTPADEDWEASLPTELPNAEETIVKHWKKLKGTAFPNLYKTEPPQEGDWSRILWRLINIMLECGLTEIEAYSVAILAECNKYRRDGRPARYLWRDVVKASAYHKQITFLNKGEFQDLSMPSIVIGDTNETFIDMYKTWATEATDAVEQFHELSAFILLSALISSSVRLKTSYGEMVPNIWGLILGDSTLSRKTTAMRMATDFIGELDRDIVLATDGSAEGLLTGLSERPDRVSIFLKDEVSGFIDSINRKDYLAGMPETLTALYDVPQFFTRRLRKEVINVRNPIFIFFGGGIREKVFSLISEEFVLSGFLPRFLVVSGETDIKSIRRTGPADEIGSGKRARLLDKLAELYELYAGEVPTKIGGQTVNMPIRVFAELTDEAWNLYGEVEHKMVIAANDSTHRAIALPTFERLSRSLLKMAILLAASRQTPSDKNTIQVNSYDVMNAASYVQQWGKYSIDLIMSAGNSTTERIIQKTLQFITRNPGVGRGTLMQRMKFTKRDADLVIMTLEERDQVRSEKTSNGRGFVYFAIS